MGRLKGFLRLSRIPKNLVQIAKNGEKGIYISVSERKEKGQYGDTHTITIWDAENKKAIYIADLRPDDYESKNSPATEKPKNSGGADEQDDLPF
jgi:hypothetical protein